MMVIGFPRALLYYELYPFWRVVLDTAGVEVAISRPTSRELIEAGTRQAVDEACLPVKAFYGHVISLRSQVDAVFLPRLVSLRRGTYTCPKLLGLPDMIRHNVEGMPATIVADVDETRPGRGLLDAGVALARRLGMGRPAARRASERGLLALRRFRDVLSRGGGFEEAVGKSVATGRLAGGTTGDRTGRPPAFLPGVEVSPIRNLRSSGANGKPRVGLVGHPYNLFDPGINLGVARRLRGLGCEVLTSEILDDDEVQSESVRLPKEVFWSSGRRVLSAVTAFRTRDLVDGIIHIVSFGCGPDSMVGEIAERETRRFSNISYMVLTVDEHTAEAGVVTRLEAFVDMLSRRRRSRAGRGTGKTRGLSEGR